VGNHQVDNLATVKIDYLNPYKDHNEQLNLDMFVDGDINELHCYGSGPNWSVKIQRRDRARFWRVFGRAVPIALVLFANLVSSLLSSLSVFSPGVRKSYARIVLILSAATILALGLAWLVSRWRRIHQVEDNG
jgi:hypothetical protein